MSHLSVRSCRLSAIFGDNHQGPYGPKMGQYTKGTPPKYGSIFGPYGPRWLSPKMALGLQERTEMWLIFRIDPYLFCLGTCDFLSKFLLPCQKVAPEDMRFQHPYKFDFA